jgi:transposase
MAFELGEKNWKLALGDGVRGPSRYTVSAGDTAALLECIAKAKARCALAAETRVHGCYEAGRDGFWLHRWLLAQGIDNVVVDSASIEVNRRARRAKTDRLDADKLLSMLIRYHADEPRVWSVVRVPTPEQEDARRAHRELGRLGHERTAHINRIRALLVLNNLRVKYVGGRLWQRWWAGHAQELAPGVRAEIARESERLLLVKKQMDMLEAAQRQAVAAGSEPQVAGLEATRDRDEQRLGVGEGALRLAALSQPARGGRLSRADALALRQRGERDRAGHFQGRQSTGAYFAGGARLELAALPAAE